jgi:hypothetical protein
VPNLVAGVAKVGSHDSSVILSCAFVRLCLLNVNLLVGLLQAAATLPSCFYDITDGTATACQYEIWPPFEE